MACLVITTVMKVKSKVWFAQQSSAFASIVSDIGYVESSKSVKVIPPNAIYPL